MAQTKGLLFSLTAVMGPQRHCVCVCATTTRRTYLLSASVYKRSSSGGGGGGMC